MFKKVLIANRGEVALRIQRACREMGIQTVMIYSEGDVNAKYLRLADEAVCIGPPPVIQSYLNASAIIAAAEIAEVDAIHPGYGFLSENADFASQVKKSGFTFIGSSPESIRLMGDKIAAKIAANSYGLKTIPGSEGALPQSVDEAVEIIAALDFPVVIKATAGGGGRGMRVVHTEMQAKNVLPVLQQEAQNAFGNATLYAERYLENPRHIEVQVLSDGRRFLHLGTRDCSLQRRHQKVLEEAPAPNISYKKQDNICNACVNACRKMNYVGVGTFEFLYDGGEFYFIEMNTRLQVEHPVTEMVTGIDIVNHQIRVAAGEELTLRQKDIDFYGHAIECRINAEDPDTFVPSPGKIDFYHTPGGLGVRVDSHIYAGYEVPPFYDSLISKLITHGGDRDIAIARMASALREYVIEGIPTNLPLHARMMEDETFRKGGIGVYYLDSRTGVKK